VLCRSSTQHSALGILPARLFRLKDSCTIGMVSVQNFFLAANKQQLMDAESRRGEFDHFEILGNFGSYGNGACTEAGRSGDGQAFF